MRVLVGFTCLGLSSVFAFAPASPLLNQQRVLSDNIRLASTKDSTAVESEAERLLRKARELRAQAEQAEQEVHQELAKKKSGKDTQTDALIEELFFKKSSDGLVDRLRGKKLSIQTLERIVDRLDEREVEAQGGERVKFEMVGGKAKAKRVSQKDEKELERIQPCIDQLIAAAAVLDKEFLDTKSKKGQQYVSHAEADHWGGGNCSKRLEARILEIRRERSEQFQKRMEEFREAQRRKEGQKYENHDLGTLN